MFWYGNGEHLWVAVVMSVGMLVFWALVVWWAIVLFRGSSWGSQSAPPPDPAQILKARLARGEINTDEYERLQELIGSNS
jgi:putative membrane protein